MAGGAGSRLAPAPERSSGTCNNGGGAESRDLLARSATLFLERRREKEGEGGEEGSMLYFSAVFALFRTNSEVSFECLVQFIRVFVILS